MKVTEALKDGKLHLSFEVFPPKTSTAMESVREAVREIAALKPSFISVTYGAGGGTSDFTLSLAEEIMKTHGVPSLAHLTCVSSSRETVRRRIAEMKQAGIENVMALRGDIPPEKAGEDRSEWDFHYAIELIRHLKEKADAGCDVLTTQMFFDNNLLYRYLYRIREAGITLPILPGIMPITSATQVERAIRLSGSFMPTRFRSLVDRFGSHPAAMKQAGILYAADQITDLFANGVKNVHVYTMNKPDVAAKIMEYVSEMLK